MVAKVSIANFNQSSAPYGQVAAACFLMPPCGCSVILHVLQPWRWCRSYNRSQLSEPVELTASVCFQREEELRKEEEKKKAAEERQRYEEERMELERLEQENREKRYREREMEIEEHR